MICIEGNGISENDVFEFNGVVYRVGCDAWHTANSQTWDNRVPEDGEKYTFELSAPVSIEGSETPGYHTAYFVWTGTKGVEDKENEGLYLSNLPFEVSKVEEGISEYWEEELYNR